MTRVQISKHNRGPYKVAAIDLPVIVGDVPGSISIRCAHESACGALASAAMMAEQVMADPTIGAIVPENAADDVSAVKHIAYAARAGFPTLHAASLQMTRGQRKLARALQDEARRFGGPGDDEARQVAGFFDSITDLARSAANSITNAADPDHWPGWMKKIAKPLGRAALDAAATAVLGPAGPVAVETMINVVDKARAGDPDAEKQIEAIAKKALKGDKVSKVLMSAVHHADGSTSQAPGNTPAVSGGTFDAWMEQFGQAYLPGAFGDGDDGDDSYDGDDGYSRMLPPPAYYEGAPYPQPYADDDASQPWPVDDQGNPWPADDQGNPVDPSTQAPQVDPSAIRDHTNIVKGNRGAGARGGGVTITQGAPRGGAKGGGFGGARDSRSKGTSRDNRGGKPRGFGGPYRGGAY